MGKDMTAKNERCLRGLYRVREKSKQAGGDRTELQKM